MPSINRKPQTFAKVGQRIAKLVEDSGLCAHERDLAMDVAKMIIYNAAKQAALAAIPPEVARSLGQNRKDLLMAADRIESLRALGQDPA